MRDMDYSGLPESLRGGVQRYIEEGSMPGGFLTAVLENNLMESFSRADEVNQVLMFQIVKWFYNDAPRGCWGSKEAVKNWTSDIKSMK